MPPPDLVEELAEFVGGVAGGKIWSSFQLSMDLPGIRISPDIVCGVLAIPLSQRPRDYLLFFRREMVQTLSWAGNPEKSYGTGPSETG